MSRAPLTLAAIVRFWIPLAGTWLMMAVEGPLIAAVIARLPDARENLAAFGVAFAFGLILESPVVMLLIAATALPVEVRELTHGALVLLLPWPGAIGYRRFKQGLLIRHGLTNRVAYGTMLRLAAMAGTALPDTPPLWLQPERRPDRAHGNRRRVHSAGDRVVSRDLGIVGGLDRVRCAAAQDHDAARGPVRLLSLQRSILVTTRRTTTITWASSAEMATITADPLDRHRKVQCGGCHERGGGAGGRPVPDDCLARTPVLASHPDLRMP